MTKTNAMRILESAGIEYTAHEYDVNEDDLTGITVANKIGAEPESVFKTLVTTGDKTGLTVFCIPVTSELDLKKAAAVSGNKKVEMIKMKDLQPLTGYIRGGCSPIGMKKLFPTYIDETAILYDVISVSAGTRGVQIKLSPEKLREVVNAEFTDVSFQ